MTDAPCDREDVSPLRARLRPLDALGLFARGIAMGAADIVPGVSGGTIALISGIYERMIDALGTLSPAFIWALARGDGREAGRRLVAMRWEVLVPIFGGVLISDIVMSGVIPRLMEDSPGPTYAFIFGLILAAVWVPFARMRRRSVSRFLVVGVAAAGAWGFVGLQPRGLDLVATRADPGAEMAIYQGRLESASDFEAVAQAARRALGDRLARVVVIDPAHVAAGLEPDAGVEVIALANRAALEPWRRIGAPVVVLGEARASLPAIFGYGVIAISAMILPGVSGAFLMLFFGQYHALLSSIHGVFGPLLAWIGVGGGRDALGGRPWLDDALFLGVFNLGVFVGIVTFSRVVRWLLHHAHDVTMAALTGLMIGALRQPGGEVLRAAAAGGGGGDYIVRVGLAALAGAAVVTLLNVLDARLRARRESTSAPATDPTG